MVLYKCECCNFSSKLKGDYKRHLITKKHLTNNHNSLQHMVMSTNEHKMSTNEHKMSTNEHKMSTNEHKFSCEFCGELFSTHANKRRHELHYCKENGSSKKIINEKNKLIKVMQKQIDKLIDKAGNTTTITNNIQLNNYGNEDLSHITNVIKDSMLKLPYGMIPKMVEAIHFNDTKPENKNIILPNKNENKIKIFKHNKWVYKSKDDIINDLIDGKYFILDTHYDDICNTLDNVNKMRYSKFRYYFDEKTNKLFYDLTKECELLLLNNR